ncbi:MAG: type IV toxin-antitoxin system AbiEi family antitoxin [Kiritimatiellia bacterium]
MHSDQTVKDVLHRAVAAVAAEVSDVKFGAIQWQPAARQDGRTPGPRLDAELTISTAGKSRRFLVEVKNGVLTSAALPSLDILARRIASDASLLVVASQIGPSVAKALRKCGVAFMDTAGNAFLPAPGLHVWISGKRTDVKRVTTGLHQQSAVKVIFALLTDPLLDRDPGAALLNRPVRSLAKAADVALGSVSHVLGSLQSLGYLLEDGDRRLLVERERLIEIWATDYLARLRHRLVHHRFRVSNAREWVQMARLPPDAWWGGEVAGALLTKHLRPEKITIYARALPAEWIVRAGLTPDTDGNVEVLTPFWGDPLASLWLHNPKTIPLDCVHPLLVYADLLAIDDERTTETAKRLYDIFLRRIATPD